MASPRKLRAENDRELQLMRKLDSEYLHPGIIDPRSLFDMAEDTRSWFDDIKQKLNCENELDLTTDKFNSNKNKKETLSEWLESAVELLGRQEGLIMHMLGIVDKHKTMLVTAEQKVGKLQEELLVKKDEQLKLVQLSVTSTVQNIVQQEMRTYSEVLKSAPSKPSFSEENLKTAVRDVFEREDRSKNLIIHGLKEETDEKLSEKVSSLFEELGENPKIEVCRIGRVTYKETSTRPVKVVFSNSTSPRMILQRSKNLKRIDRHKTVYINPDRTPEERIAHKELVQALKKIRADDPNSYHFIKDGKVCSVGRTDK